MTRLRAPGSCECVLDELRLNPDFESVFQFYITTRGITAEVGGEIPK